MDNDGASGNDGGSGEAKATPGRDTVIPGFGLRGMTDRCARLGGTLRYGFLPGGGFRVEAALPRPENG